ncbi:MAG TPA: hypothetical protein VFP60_19650 [Pseudolabrys sp.]|nr:hypothetical protein [Pseudolabrys sp.]
MRLALQEPSFNPDYDQRTFECANCGSIHSEIVPNGQTSEQLEYRVWHDDRAWLWETKSSHRGTIATGSALDSTSARANAIKVGLDLTKAGNK